MTSPSNGSFHTLNRRGADAPAATGTALSGLVALPRTCRLPQTTPCNPTEPAEAFRRPPLVPPRRRPLDTHLVGALQGETGHGSFGKMFLATPAVDTTVGLLLFSRGLLTSVGLRLRPDVGTFHWKDTLALFVPGALYLCLYSTSSCAT